MRDYYLSKIANIKELRNHFFTLLIALTTGLSSLFIGNTTNPKIVFLAIIGGFVDVIVFLQYIRMNRLMNKYMEKLK